MKVRRRAERKTKVIIVCGVPVRVLACDAGEFYRIDSAQMLERWNRNDVD